MKITKSYLKQIIKEELSKLDELEYSPQMKATRREKSSKVYGANDEASQDEYSDLEDELEVMNTNDLKVRLPLIPKDKREILKRNSSLAAKFRNAGF